MKRTPRKICWHGHALSGENVVVEGGVRRCRACRKAARAKTDRSGNFSEPILRRVVLAINEGGTRNSLAGHLGDRRHALPIVVKATRLNAFIRENPKLGAWMVKKMGENARKRTAEGHAARRIHIAAPALVRSMDVLDDINAALTMWLDPVVERHDIVQDIWLAVAEGRLRRDQIGLRAREFVAAHRRGFSNTGRYAFGSLDAPIGPDNPTSRLELLAADAGIWS